MGADRWASRGWPGWLYDGHPPLRLGARERHWFLRAAVSSWPAKDGPAEATPGQRNVFLCCLSPHSGALLQPARELPIWRLRQNRKKKKKKKKKKKSTLR